MALTMRVQEDDYPYQETISQLTPKTIQLSMEKFEVFREKGIIKAESYEADVWYITDEVHKGIALRLGLDELSFARDAQPLLHCSAGEFGTVFRVVITSSLGRSLSGMQNLVNTIRNYVCRDKLAPSKIADIGANGPDLVNLLMLLPGESPERLRVIDDIQDHMEAYEDKKRSGGQRALAYYQTFFRFDHFLWDFWAGASEEEKLLFFPIYLWWQITMIIPLRPTEFVLTPRDCIIAKDGKTSILLRRTKLKGASQAVSYKISEDYVVQNYNIPESLAEEIRWYQKETAKVYESDIDTLFSKNIQFTIAGVQRDDDHHYTYANLGQCLERYYRAVLMHKYRLKMIDDKETALQEMKIGRISLGDTRHIALINLVLSGASLQACKELAGHHHIITASHYYSNIKSFLDVLTLEQYRMPADRLAQETMLPAVSDGIPVNRGEGLCFSQRAAAHDYSDCACACDQYGYPGTCDCCQYYLPNSTVKGKEICRHAEEQLHYTCVLLEKALDQYRKGIGKEQTIRCMLDQLSTDAQTYANHEMLRKRRGYYYV